MKLCFAQNVKYLREKNGLKQSEMLDFVGFPQSTWNNYEKGKSMPNVADLIKLSQKFDILESDLLHSDLSKGNLIKNETVEKNRQNGNLKGNPMGNLIEKKSLQKGNYLAEPPVHYGARSPTIITINEAGFDNIIYVPIKAQAGYLIGYGDQEFIENLPTFRMPGLNHSTYRMFEVQGVSMSPTLSDRDRVIAEWVPSLSEIRDNRVHVVVLRDGVVVKRVLNRIQERNKLYLQSDTVTHRADYPLREIDPEEVLEVWSVRLKVSSDLSSPSTMYTRLADLEINQAEMMRKLGM